MSSIYTKRALSLKEFADLYRRCSPTNPDDMGLLMMHALRLGFRPHFQNVDTSSFMIRNRDGYFSNGGSPPSFDTDGRRWQTLQEVQRHLENLGRVRVPIREVYNGCLIVEYQLQLVTEHDVVDTYTQILEAKRMAEEERQRRLEERRRKRHVIETSVQDMHQYLEQSDMSPDEIAALVAQIKEKSKGVKK